MTECPCGIHRSRCTYHAEPVLTYEPAQPIIKAAIPDRPFTAGYFGINRSNPLLAGMSSKEMIEHQMCIDEIVKQMQAAAATVSGCWLPNEDKLYEDEQ